jgi:Protein kinase domain
MSSSSFSEAPARLGPGLEVAGFRLERELGRGADTVVFEATQLSLDRRVALKLLPAGDDPGAIEWPEHRHVVSLYAAGSWEHGRYVAMQLVRGSTLAQLLQAGKLEPRAALDALAGVASALDAAHAAGIVHGGITGRNVLVGADGKALLSDFGLADGAGVAGDRADFAALLRRCLGGRELEAPREASATELVRLARAQLPPPPRRRRRGLLAAGACALAAAAAALVLVLAGSDGQSVPAVERGTLALGSALAAGGISSVDCSGRPASGGSPACTLVQAELPGRRLEPARAGVIRRWVVRGARGELALQVIRRRGGEFVSAARTHYELVPDEGVHVLPANLAVRPGDRIGVELAPGASIGVRRSVPGATTERWIGPLFLVSRPVELGAGSGFDHEVMLRVEFAPGAEFRVPGQLSGSAAERAPAGRELSSVTVEVEGQVRRVAAVRLAGGIAIDLFAGPRRLARVPVPDADPAGELLDFGAGYTTRILRWRNPDGETVRHEYTVRPGTLMPRG